MDEQSGLREGRLQEVYGATSEGREHRDGQVGSDGGYYGKQERKVQNYEIGRGELRPQIAGVYDS